MSATLCAPCNSAEELQRVEDIGPTVAASIVAFFARPCLERLRAQGSRASAMSSRGDLGRE
jgi:NAD-dependent DNA ligase